MRPQPNVASVASLIADPARAAMLMALADGRARPAGELAYAAGVTAQTASTHLAKLLAGDMLTVETEGRHRYYRLAGSHIAQALEQLASIGPAETIRRKPLSQAAQSLQLARRCYDHLAGRLGVAVTLGMTEREFLVPAHGKQFAVTERGLAWFCRMGLDVGSLRATRRGLARQCLDWTERQHHLAGPLGVQFMSLLCTKGWVVRLDASRAMRVTQAGWTGLRDELGVRREEVTSFR